MDVTTTPQRLGSSGYLIQNLGPDPLYVGESTVTEDNGVKLESGVCVVVGNTSNDVYVVSEGTSEIQLLGEGMGLFSPAAEAAEPPDLTAYVPKSLYDANSILAATTDDTPAVLTVAASRIIGRKASGGIAALTGAEVQALLDLSGYQPLDSDLTAIAALTTTSYGRALLALADAAALGATVGGEVFKQAQATNAQTGTSYTLVAGDVGKLVTLSNASAIALTLPQDSDATIAVGSYVDFYALGAGQITAAAGSGATMRVSGLTAKSRAQYARFGAQKVSANTWVLFGDLAAS
jgi:hypothetical protein